MTPQNGDFLGNRQRLANRLSEDAGARVLLFEAGGPDRNPYIHIPLGMGRMHEHHMFNWGYKSEPEPNMDGRRIEAMRGKVLGGSSSINVMAYTPVLTAPAHGAWEARSLVMLPRDLKPESAPDRHWREVRQYAKPMVE